ncbi:MAG: pyridoxal phosphate-dependent aminotransferase [Clostridiaceae bacterium]|nr:pyridoxal phosphate-dependent aminotransferase [Clostridiaceae bacterium]
MYISRKAQSISPSSTLAIDAKFKAMKAKGIDVVGFGAGEPDFDTPSHIKEAAIKAINDGFTKYTPASGMPQLKQAVCRKLKRDNGLDYSPEQIVISNGAKHSLVNVFTAICDPGDEVIIPAPFWVSYPEMVKLADGVPVYVHTTEENGFKFTIEDLKKAITPRTRALILNSPSNPTGMVYTRDELKKIAEVAVENNIYVISDEIYEKLIYDGMEHVSIASFGDEIKDLTIIVNGVSKTYAMTGWRIGYTASNAQIAKVMGNVQSHATSNPNSMAQVASITALDGPQEDIEIMKKAFVERRDYMVDRINSIEGLSCVKPQGAFYVLMNIKKILGSEFYGTEINTSDEFADVLLEKAKVALVPGSGFGAEGYVRWSYATSMENIIEGLNRVEKFIKNEL